LHKWHLTTTVAFSLQSFIATLSPKVPLPMGSLGRPIYYTLYTNQYTSVVPCAPRVHKPNGNWIGSARLANVSNTHRQTEHGIPVNIRHIIHYAQQCGQKGIILLLIIKPYHLLTQQLLTFHPSHGINNQQWSGTQSRISSTDVLDSTKIHLSTPRWTRSTNEHRATEINQQLLINISFTSPSKHNAFIPTVVRILVHCTAAVKAACRTAWWKLFWYRGMDGYSEAGEYGNSKIWRQMRL